MATKRSFQPPLPAPVVSDDPLTHAETQPIPGAGFKIPKFPKPTANSAPVSAVDPLPSSGRAIDDVSPEPDKPSVIDRAPIDVDRKVRAAPDVTTPVIQAKAKEVPPSMHLKVQPGEIVQNLPIDSIRRSPFQSESRLDEGHIAELAENIRAAGGLYQPILVRAVGEDFELIAGEHRYEAVKLNGQVVIPAIVREMDDNQAARALLFENLFHRPLSDFQIYQSFKQLLSMNAVKSLRSLARETADSFAQVQRLMMFDHFPSNIHNFLNEHPNLIGANAAEALAKHIINKREDLVVEALRLIQDGKLTQGRASAWIEARFSAKPARTSRVLTRGNQGQEFCTLMRDGSQIKIRVASDIDSAALEEALYETLQRRAAEAPSKEDL